MSASSTVAVVGLGYVGLPLAVAFGRQRPTVGFDLSKDKVAAYREGRDPTGEVSEESFRQAKHLRCSTDAAARILAVAHKEILARPVSDLAAKTLPGGCLVDVKSKLNPKEVAEHGLKLWRL